MRNKKTYLVFVIQAYVSQAEDGRVEDVVTLEIIAKNADEAVDKAKKIISKNHYRISGVIENFYGE